MLALFLSTNIYYRLTTVPYWQHNWNVLVHPFSLKDHVVLAQDAWLNNNWQEAKNELMIAQSLLKNPGQDAISNVLGTSTTPLDLLRQWEQEPARLADAEHFWQTVVAQKADYRDAYIQLAAINYQLNNDQKAASYLATARDLDPNSVAVQKLSALLAGQSK